MDDKKYCLRAFRGKYYTVWELGADCVPTGTCLRGYPRGDMISVYPWEYGKSKLFDADVRTFVPLHKVKCRWDSQIAAIKKDIESGIITVVDAMADSIETERRKGNVG